MIEYVLLFSLALFDGEPIRQVLSSSYPLYECERKAASLRKQVKDGDYFCYPAKLVRKK